MVDVTTISQFSQASKSTAVTSTTSFSLNQAKAGMTSVANVKLPSEMIKHKAASKPTFLLSNSTAKVNEESKIALIDNATIKDYNSNIDSEIEEDKNVLDEMVIGKGIGNALKVMRNRGVLGKTQVKGRNLDPSTESQLKGFSKTKDGTQEADRIKLKHFDKKGKELSMKEAFRQQCWKFHGIMPSHRKREKMAKKEETLNKIAVASSALGSLTAGTSSLKSLGSLGALQPPTKAKKK